MITFYYNMAPNPLKVEGRITRLTYLQPEGRSALEVVRGYGQSVADAGGSKLWDCSANVGPSK